MSDNDQEVKKSAATTLVEMVEERYELGVSTDGEVFAVPLLGDPVVRPLRAGRLGLRAEMAKTYLRSTGRAAPQQALADALLVIEGIAAEKDPVPLWQRVAPAADGAWIDLGDQSGDAVRVSPQGWRVGLPPLRFRRTALSGPLPRPTRDGELAELWELLNVAEVDRPLVLAWLIAAMLANVPHPILTLTGEQGTGKSTATKMLVALLDPSPVPLRKSPRDADSWVTAASGSWIVAIDNVSVVPEWFSDSLCRAVTGDGDVRRQLYTDGGLHVFSFRRCILLNGIDLGAVRGDLADRLLIVDLDVIGEDDRRLDAEMADIWQQAHPRILGALLTLAASVASVLPSVHLERSPRMADFARVLAAVDAVLGTDGLGRYLDRGRFLAADALSADPVVAAIASTTTTMAFEGTSAALLTQIDTVGATGTKGWPANARQLTTLLRRQAPVMRKAGWTVDELPAGHDNALRWRIARPEIARIGRSQDSQRSRTASVASVASDECTPSQDDQAEKVDVAEVEPRPGNALCTVCGKTMFAPQSISRGICASCVKVAEVAS